jgi:hypothetical protein
MKRLGDLLQHQDRGIANAVFEVGEMPFRDACGLGGGPPRHAAP